MEQTDFLNAIANSWNFGRERSKMDVLTQVMGLQNWMYLKNEMMEQLNFCMLMQIYENLKLIEKFLVGLDLKWTALL